MADLLSDAEVVSARHLVLGNLGTEHEALVLSTHRAPKELQGYVEQLETSGMRAIIAVAELAAHLQVDDRGAHSTACFGSTGSF